MKTTTLLFLSFFMLISIKAQTITVDGNMSDWAEVPVLSEPGVFPYAKVHYVSGGDVFFSLGYDPEGTDEFRATSVWNFANMYIDADNGPGTGNTNYVYPQSGWDYTIDGPELLGFTGANQSSWAFGTNHGRVVRGRSADGKQAEVQAPRTLFAGIPLDDNIIVVAPRYFIEGAADGEHYIQAINYSFTHRKGFTVKPRTITTENVGVIELTSANAFYMPFMRDENINEYLDFQSGSYPTQDPDQWASWAIDLTTPAIYDIKMTYSCDAGGGAKMDFYLVDMATNETVYSQEDIDYEATAGEFTERQLNSQLDLSAVPAGKYMLKIKKQVKWDANNLKVQKLTLENTSPPTYNPIVKNNVSIWSESTTLFLKSATACNLNVYSLTGVEVFSAENALSLKTELPQGVFIVKTSIAGKTLAQKVVIK